MIAAAIGLALALGPPLDGVADLARAGDAGAAYLRLTREIDDGRVEAGAPGARFLGNLLRYLRCDAVLDVGPVEAGDRLRFAEAHGLFRLEQLRLARRARERHPGGPEQWLAEGRLRWSLPAFPPLGGPWLQWPPTDEKWSDEEALVATPPLRCPTASRGKPGDATGPRRRERGAVSGRQLLVDEAEAMRAARRALATGTPVRSALLLDEAVLRARLGEWSEAWVLVRLLDEELATPGAGALVPREQIEHTLLSALSAEEEKNPVAALARWQAAAALPLDSAERLFVDVHRQRHLVEAGRFAEARAILEAHEHEAGPLARFLTYRMALVRFRLGDEPALLGSARALLGRRTAAEVAADAPSRATEELVYLSLAAHRFEPRLVEIVESIGAVDEVFGRLDALGAVAFDHGRVALAADIYRHLLEHHGAWYLRPYYLGRLAAAAAALGSTAEFAARFTELVEAAMPVAPPLRARRQTIETHRQLLLTTRDCVAALAGRGDAAGLAALVTQLQRYLRAVGGKGPYAEVATLYRLASTQLPRGSARRYAEKIGSSHPPVWLGDVRLDRPSVLVTEPALDVPPLYGPETLLCIPDGNGACPRWTGPPPATPREVADAG